MRDLFTVVAVLIVAVLCAALAVPYAVDWQAWRGDVEAALGKAFGVPVHTEGAITVRLLPTPRLALDRVALGGAAPFLTAEALNVSLEAPPLLGGKVRVNEARLVRPTVSVRVDAAGAFHLPAASDTPLLQLRNAGIDRLVVDGGIVRIVGDAGAGGMRHDIGPIDFTAQATTFAGPWRVDGTIAGHTVHLATGAFENDGRLRMKVRVGEAGETQGEFDGHLLPGAIPALSGRIAASVPLPEIPVAPPADGAAPETVSLTLAAIIGSEGWRIAAKDVTLRTGDGNGALALGGEAAFDVSPLLKGGKPLLELALTSRRIDITPLLPVIAGQADTGSRRVLDSLRARLVTGGLADMPADVSLSVGSVALSGIEAGPVSIDLKTEREADGLRIAISHLALTLPGGGTLGANGVAAWSARPAFSGRVDLTGGDTLRLAGALHELGAPERLTAPLLQWPGLTFAGQVDATADDIAVHGFKLAAGRTTVAGSLRQTAARGELRGRIDAQLSATGLDLSALPSFDPASLVQAGTDLGVSIEATGLRLGDEAASPDRRLRARFETSSAGISIERFEIRDPAGATFSASGHLDDDGGRVVAKLNAQKPESVVEVARSFLPGTWRAALTRAVPFAGPLALDATVARPGAGRPLVAVLRGRAGDMDIDAHVTSDPAGADNDRAVIAATLTAPDAKGLLRRTGIAGGTVRASERKEKAVVRLDARGNSFSRLEGEAALDLGTSRAAVSGTWRDEGGEAALTGTLTAASDDTAAFAALIGHPLPGLSGGAPASLAGNVNWRAGELRLDDLRGTLGDDKIAGRLAVADGEIAGELAIAQLSLTDLLALSFGPQIRPAQGRLWSAERFQATGPGFAGKIRVRTERLAVAPALALTGVSLLLDLSPDTVGLQEVAGTLPGGGTARADILLRRFGTLANFRAALAVEGADIAQLTGDTLAGRLSGRLDVGSSAESPAGLVVNLAGGGEIKVGDAALPRLDPSALARLVPEWLGSGDAEAPIDADIGRLTGRLGTELDKAAWPIRNLTFPLTVAGGAVRFGPLALEAAQAKAGINGTLDLATLTLDARANLTATTAPKDWTGTPPQAVIAWRGPLAGLKRSIDAGSTANALAAIGLTRELDRIERLEAEARQRVEQARLARQERARQEQERLEQQRLERERQEQQRQQEQRLERERQERERLMQQEQPPARQPAGAGGDAPSPNAPLVIAPDAAYP
ncbi:AsmA family protein [Pseudochelatococcus lubricantis]|uniref:AsmA family protein n=1 Tax=Pseudochelatococcus lubricantis TaxID=1538102 RepID=UPI0035E70A7C